MFSNGELGSLFANRFMIVVAAIVAITVAISVTISVIVYTLNTDCPYTNGDMIVISDNLRVPPVTFVQCTFYGGLAYHSSVGYMSIEFDR